MLCDALEIVVIKFFILGDTCVVQLAKCLCLRQGLGHDPGILGSSPTSHSLLGGELASLSAALPACALICSISLSLTNEEIKSSFLKKGFF